MTVAARLGLVLVVAALLAAVLPAGSGAADECNGIPRCIPVQGPWVIVGATGESDYMLECPAGKGVVAGTDSLASSQDVHATFDGILGSPVAFGRTTNATALFRAVSARHTPGSFEPFVGCIPTSSSRLNTLSAQLSPVGPPLDLRATTIKLRPGSTQTARVACGAGEILVDSWSARAFATSAPPLTELATLIDLGATQIHSQAASLRITTNMALPTKARAEVQLGVRCAQG